MPAFDPVRDAVLNSPVTPTQSLAIPGRDFQPSSHHNHISPIHSTTVSDSHHATATLTRRATDLSVLLNSDSQHPTPWTPRTPTPAQPSSLSHLLLPTDDALADVESLRRPAVSHTKYEASSHTPPPTLHSDNSPAGSRPSEPTLSPRNPMLPVVSPRPPSRLAYHPVRRLTPATSVLVPLTDAEMEKYKNFRGLGTQRLAKRKRETSVENINIEPPHKKLAGDVGVVVTHYNTRPEVGIDKRQESPIIGLKSFNNWIKSVLIKHLADPVLKEGSPRTTNMSGLARRSRAGTGKVLDIGIGKGGDLNKWLKANIRELVGVDIAAVSIEQARSRWETIKGPRFDATFAALDCYSEPLTQAFRPEIFVEPFDVVSMQFCMHYAFENAQKARCMLDNVSRWLRPGGAFIGTIPNAEQLLERLDALPPDAEELSFGNPVYKVRFEERESGPVFGHKYWFYLQDAVENVPEYIVPWEIFVEMASEFRLYPVYKKEFHHVFEENHEHPEFGPLLEKMKVVDGEGDSSLDEDQWEAANIYIAFAFKKR